MIIYSIMSMIRLKKFLEGSRAINENIYQSENLKTPFVLGLFKPKIYIPSGLNENEKSYIILHEKTHIRRHDHVIKYLSFLILSIHWECVIIGATNKSPQMSGFKRCPYYFYRRKEITFPCLQPLSRCQTKKAA
ncbi:M56 family metallopeptidase [Oxobacter pfennigii]|uniref:M56 family metallopeptidase n=1 Tax=Oxobacter pfennigii TaxID=36849 RepID=UPI001364B9BF|nr:M56 family metallopeptidase [Oxobacter pfennigii]